MKLYVICLTNINSTARECMKIDPEEMKQNRDQSYLMSVLQMSYRIENSIQLSRNFYFHQSIERIR